jgi:hypothetical protein
MPQGHQPRSSLPADPLSRQKVPQAANISVRMIVNEAGDQHLMDYPWKEQATLVRVFEGDKSDGQTNKILFEGPLLALAEKMRYVGNGATRLADVVTRSSRSPSHIPGRSPVGFNRKHPLA